MGRQKKTALEMAFSKTEQEDITNQDYKASCSNYSRIPKQLKAVNNWLVRSGGETRRNKVSGKEYTCSKQVGFKVGKVPFNAITGKAFISQADCTSFDAVMDKVGYYDGLGFYLGASDSPSAFTCIDIDHCVTNGAVNAFALDIIMRCGSYWEYSPGGEGVHIWLKGIAPFSVHTKTIEIYSYGRYITMTGHTTTNLDIVEGQDIIDELCLRYGKKPLQITEIDWGDYEDLSDIELYSLISVMRSKGSSEKFIKLFDEGDTSLYGGDTSRADMALLNILAWWTKGNPIQIEQLFNQGKLADREKWQVRNDYRERSIGKAIAFYTERIVEYMALDYFPHKYGVWKSSEMRKLIRTHTKSCFGWYWYLVEYLAELEGHRLNISDEEELELIADDLECKTEVLLEFINDLVRYNLFCIEGEFVSDIYLNNHFEIMKERSKIYSENGKRGGLSKAKKMRENQIVTDIPS